MAFYYEEEWAKYTYDVESDVPDARLPELARPCLLCLRYDTDEIIMMTRTQNVQFATDVSASAPDVQPTIVQPHFNMTGVDGEYRLEDCNAPVSGAYEGILYPIVKPSLTQFVRDVDAETGLDFFRQLFPYPNTGAAQSALDPAF